MMTAQSRAPRSSFRRPAARACGAVALGVALFAHPATQARTSQQGAAAAAPGPPASCDDLLLPPRDAKGHKVGPASCLMQETQLTFEGRAFKRLDIGLD